MVIDIPKDMQNWEGSFEGSGLLAVRGYRQRMSLVEDNVLTDSPCKEFYELLQKSERPLIYAGGGVVNGGAADAVRKFAARFGIPVTTTLMGIGAVVTFVLGIILMQIFSRPKKVKFAGEYQHYGADRAKRDRDLDVDE